MKKWFFTVLAGLALLSEGITGDGRKVGWREDFSQANAKKFPVGWKFDGSKFMVARTQFRVEHPADNSATGNGNVLVVEANRSTGAIITIPGPDLKKYPILRWRWRVKNLPPNADGRTDLDDQAVSVYFGAGGPLSRKSIAFRWETDMPIGHSDWLKYGAGIVTVKYQCIRNRTSPLNEWLVEERDVATEFEKVYGYLPPPKLYVVSVSGNSQYTNSHTIAEIDYLELVERPKKP